jgi:hypothetical protein
VQWCGAVVPWRTYSACSGVVQGRDAVQCSDIVK